MYWDENSDEYPMATICYDMNINWVYKFTKKNNTIAVTPEALTGANCFEESVKNPENWEDQDSYKEAISEYYQNIKKRKYESIVLSWNNKMGMFEVSGKNIKK